MTKAKQRALLAILLVAPLGVAGFFAFRVVQFGRYMASRPPVPGEAEFFAANRKILLNRGETAFGNSEEARELALLYGGRQAAMRAKFFEGGHRADLSLTEGHFLVYSHLTDEACVFLVHVPELRQYTQEARAELRRRSWAAARDLLAEKHVEREQLAVALRGAVIFDFIAVDEPDEDLILHDQAFADPSILYRYFRPGVPTLRTRERVADVDLARLPGRWSHDRGGQHTEVQLEADGTFRGSLHKDTREVTFSGRWSADGDTLIWTYLESSVPVNAPEDRNRILSLTESELRLREMDGSTTLWKRMP